MTERILIGDPHVSAKGLIPAEVAVHRLTIQLYHPQSKRYVCVKQSSPKFHESASNFVCLEADYHGGGKQFLLEKVSENEYYIKEMDRDGENETGFLYVSEQVSSGLLESSANVLRSKEVTYRKELYIFQFVRHKEQMGIYKIVCKGNGMTLYGSEGRESHIKADNRDRDDSNKNWFQLSAKPHKDMKVSTVSENAFAFSGSVDPPVYIDEVVNATNFEYTHKFQSGKSNLFPIASEKRDGAKASSEVLSVSRHCISEVLIKPGKKASFHSSIYTKDPWVEKKLAVEFKNNKFQGYAVYSHGKTVECVKEDDI